MHPWDAYIGAAPRPGMTRGELAARRPREVKFAVKRRGGLWEGTVLLPIGLMERVSERVPARRGAVRTHKAGIKATVKAGDKGSAIAQAASLADQIVSNPLVAAALPPGTGAAVKALKVIGQNAPLGKLDDALKKLTGAGAGRIIDTLKFW